MIQSKKLSLKVIGSCGCMQQQPGPFKFYKGMGEGVLTEGWFSYMTHQSCC